MPGLEDELLKGEIFYTLREAQIVSDRWRVTKRDPAACQPRL
jgi:hypothetical protein